LFRDFSQSNIIHIIMSTQTDTKHKVTVRRLVEMKQAKEKLPV